MMLEIWTLYDHPTDFPNEYVARLFVKGKPTEVHVTAPTLAALRLKLPPGLALIARAPSDDPVIIESWL